MSLDSGFDAKEQVRQAVDIVDLIGSHIQLRRQGRDFVGLCPWHDDSRPSFRVNQERQSWKCWVCDIGGDIFSFVMRAEGIEFREALELLADRAGIELRQNAPKITPGSPNDKRVLYEAMKWAEEQFHQCLLRASEAEVARQYLEERGMTPASVERFQIGFSPNNWQWLVDRAKTTRYSSAVLEALGLTRQGDRGPFDFFRGRLMFSIRDTQHRPIAFAGRVLPQFADGKSGKYINSPETRLYSKSEQLYALDKARDAVSKEDRRLIVMEGYTDVIMAHQNGIREAVAVCGTALGERHIRLLRRFADGVTLVLDGDDAGQRRTNQILELFLAEEFDLRILTLPQGLDPCDFLLEHGESDFRKLLASAVDAIEHKVQSVLRNLGETSSAHQSHQAMEEILATLAKAPRLQAAKSTSLRLREQQALSQLARRFRVTDEQLRERLNELRKQSQSQTRRPESQSADAGRAVLKLSPAETELFEILIQHPELVPEALEGIQANDLVSAAARAVYQTYVRLSQTVNVIDFARLMTETEDPRWKNLLVQLDESASSKAAHAQEQPEERLRALIEQCEASRHDTQRREVIARLDEGQLNEDEEVNVLQQLLEERRSRHGISAPTDG